MDIKQSTTLSLRHLNQNNGSYLRNHMEKQMSFHSSSSGKKKKLKQRNVSCHDLGIFETETFVTDSDSDDNTVIGKEKKININKSMGFLPHTAPAYHNSSQLLSFPNIMKRREPPISATSLLKKGESDDDKTTSKSLRV